MKFLLDEHAEGFDKELMKMGHQVEYAKKLREKDLKYRNDPNVVDYAREHEMIIITKDYDMGQYCEDNKFPCIWLSDDRIFEEMIRPKVKELSTKSD